MLESLMNNSAALFAAGLGLGMLHALDADHVMTVANLGARSCARGRSMRFGVQWAMGHGVSLLAAGACVYLLGMALPETLGIAAEVVVALLLIALGVGSMQRLRHVEGVEGLPAPTRPAFAIGSLHGVAGSAPVIALIPLMQIAQPAPAVLYLLCFSLGVLLAMLGFGALLARAGRALANAGRGLDAGFQAVVAGGAIAVGTWQLYGVWQT